MQTASLSVWHPFSTQTDNLSASIWLTAGFHLSTPALVTLTCLIGLFAGTITYANMCHHGVLARQPEHHWCEHFCWLLMCRQHYMLGNILNFARICSADLPAAAQGDMAEKHMGTSSTLFQHWTSKVRRRHVYCTSLHACQADEHSLCRWVGDHG